MVCKVIEPMITLDKEVICSLCGGGLREVGYREYECISCGQHYEM